MMILTYLDRSKRLFQYVTNVRSDRGVCGVLFPDIGGGGRRACAAHLQPGRAGCGLAPAPRSDPLVIARAQAEPLPCGLQPQLKRRTRAGGAGANPWSRKSPRPKGHLPRGGHRGRAAGSPRLARGVLDPRPGGQFGFRTGSLLPAAAWLSPAQRKA